MNEDMSENTSREQSSKMNPAMVGIIVLVIALVGFYALKTYGTQNESASTDDQTIEATTMPETVIQPDQPTGDAMTDDTEITTDEVRVINVEGGGFYYSPNEIRVKKGETVKIVLNSVDMVHDFVIDELDVKTELAKEGETVTVEFTPNEAGEFEFYCSVGQHRANGMVGTLIVE